MTLSLRFFMAWVGLHVFVWAMQAYALTVDRVEYQCGDWNILICGTPLAENLDWFGERPQFALFKLFDFIFDQITKIVLLFGMDYEILYSQGLAGGPGLALQLAGIFAILGVFVTLGYQFFNR